MDNVRAEQLNILLNAIKTVVSSKNCPDWIAKRLTQAVKTAKEQTQDAAAPNTPKRPQIDYTYKPFAVDDFVASNIEEDTCVYKIIGCSDPINGINLYTLQIVEGNKTNPPGYIAYNVPETMLLHIKDR